MLAPGGPYAERQIPTFPTAPNFSPRVVLWIFGGAIAFATVGLVGNLLFLPAKSWGNLVAGLVWAIFVLLFLGVVAIHWAFTRGTPGATGIVASDRGLALTFPTRPPWTIEWARLGRGFRVVRSFGNPGKDGQDETVLEGFWKPATFIPCADGVWLLQETARRGLRITEGRRQTNARNVRIVVYSVTN